jgi:hypothetical protein
MSSYFSDMSPLILSLSNKSDTSEIQEPDTIPDTDLDTDGNDGDG